ncbi:MAG: radical SAM protein [Pseudomonadota bacterium]
MRLNYANFWDDIRVQLTDSLAYFIFYVTQRCNFECRHCFNYIENQKPGNDLTIDEIDRFSQKLGKIKYITMAGGEPMLRPQLDTIAEIFYTNNKVHILNVSTNGWLTDRVVSFVESTLSKCEGLALAIAVSLDGGRETHDKIRNKAGSFDHAVTTLKELKKLQEHSDTNRLALFAHGTYNAWNANEFLDTARFFTEEIGVPYSVAMIRGDNLPDSSINHIDVDHYHEVFKKIMPLVRKGLANNYPFRRAGVAMADLVGDVIYQSAKHNRMVVPCRAGKKCFVITSDGNIVFCEILNIVLGNLRDHNYDPMELLRSKRALKEMDMIYENKCHCTWECFQMVNVWSSPKMLAQIIRKSLSYAFHDWFKA